jgi:uncharacterized damage-inducible protein DinB
MNIKSILLFLTIFCSFQSLFAKSNYATLEMDTLPYYEIPAAPEMYNAATVSARMIDGLGFRYHWATEGLRPEDLAYEPGNNGQSCTEVLKHVLGLSRFILRTVKMEVHDNSIEYPELTWEEQRETTLRNLKEASDILRETGDISNSKIIFKRGEKMSEFPFWNLLNGPLSDAIYHTGQVVSFRRTTGNPVNSNISLFRGALRG